MRKMILNDDIPAGNWENKYESKNPVARFLMQRFMKTMKLIILQRKSEITSISEVGCGEGYVTSEIHNMVPFVKIKASDFSGEIIKTAGEKFPFLDFYVKSIYDLGPEDSADFIICCEVLEHLEFPGKALERLAVITGKYCLLTVPNEPLWRCLNMIRGKYLNDFGNTPGHIQHWSLHQFVKLVKTYMNVLMVKFILPWTLVLSKKK
ncbi:MAG: class I SAM-dependent methyltransferase [Spirochaetales bacterium]|nr:class I SAM-dependent methyltransferase [Spirochaetales bacterium]